MKIEAVGKPRSCKLIRISAEIDSNIIRAISIRGDFFASPAEGFERAEQRLVGVSLVEVAEAFDRFLAQEGVECQGITGAAVSAVLAGADGGRE
jgi:hypothetical protein